MGLPAIAEAAVAPRSVGLATALEALSSVRPLRERAQVEALVTQIVARHARSRGAPVAMRRPLIDQGVDILALIEIVSSLETELDVELDPDEILSWLTAADIAETVLAAQR